MQPQRPNFLKKFTYNYTQDKFHKSIEGNRDQHLRNLTQTASMQLNQMQHPVECLPVLYHQSGLCVCSVVLHQLPILPHMFSSRIENYCDAYEHHFDEHEDLDNLVFEYNYTWSLSQSVYRMSYSILFWEEEEYSKFKS